MGICARPCGKIGSVWRRCRAPRAFASFNDCDNDGGGGDDDDDDDDNDRHGMGDGNDTPSRRRQRQQDANDPGRGSASRTHAVTPRPITRRESPPARRN
eukprot:gene9095-biopygen9228